MFRVYLVLSVFVLLFSNQALGQIINTKLQAKIDYQISDQLLIYRAKAINKTDQTQSILADLSAIGSLDTLASQALSKQQERFVLEPLQEINLFNSSLEIQNKQRIIVLLLIYDVNQDLIAMDRVVINDNKTQADIQNDFIDELVEQQQSSDYVILKLQNIVIDQTKTKAGRDFYQLFYSQFLANNIKTNSVIKITEAMSMGSSTIVRLYVENNLVFEFFVKSQYDFIKQMSQAALARVQRYIALENQKEERLKIF
ncbi:CsgE family curli-type amyloid fiber assembly protein [Myroides sp. LJL119]